MEHHSGNEMYSWVREMFPINRSLTGEGVRKTLLSIQEKLPNLVIHEVPTGTEAFDWKVPMEWKVNQAYVEDLSGTRWIDFEKNNLHLVGYSKPINRIMSKEELDPYLHSLPHLPNAIPYVTSYYSENFGFCLEHNIRQSMHDGPYKVVIDSELFNGFMSYGELLIPGELEDEVLFSTYVCHPSMASNELSGPAVAISLAQGILEKPRRYSYRFLFLVETIGAIYYISRNLERMKNTIRAGWVLTCLGDNNTFSFVPSRDGNLLVDRISKIVLREKDPDFKEYTWFERGSDERQYCAPGVDLPIASIMRSKYGEFVEYHTSLDNLEFISCDGLQGSLEVYLKVVEILETNQACKINVLCEPMLSKRNLYPSISDLTVFKKTQDLMNVISCLDGKTDLIQIAETCSLKYDEVLSMIQKLIDTNLVIIPSYKLN